MESINHQNFLLPVEIKNRELNAMILLACVLAERGRHVIIGDKRTIKMTIHRFPPSLYLGKSVTANIYRHYYYYQGLGHTVTALDEEGLVIYSKDIYLTRRVGMDSLRNVTALFAWGKENAEIWQSQLSESQQAKVHLTGNPRFDLLRPPLREIFREAAEHLKRQYGPYVLFNSNFHWVNTCGQFNTRLPDPDDIATGKIQVPPFYNPELARYRIGLFRAYLDALPRLAARFPDTRFILRPHPAENPLPWEQATAHLDNCHVIHEGEVIPWILGSEAVLHHSCTTAVEATVLGKPVLCYRPLKNAALDPELPIRLSRQATSEETLIALLEEVLSSQTTSNPSSIPDYLKQHATALEEELACDRIARIMLTITPAKPSLTQVLSCWKKKQVKQTTRKIKSLIGKPVRSANPHIFAPTSLEEVKQRASAYGKLLNRFDEVQIEELQPNIFRFQKHVAR